MVKEDYEPEDIQEVFDVDEWWTFTRELGDIIADYFSDWENITREDFQQAIDDMCYEISRVVFDEAHLTLSRQGANLW